MERMHIRVRLLLLVLLMSFLLESQAATHRVKAGDDLDRAIKRSSPNDVVIIAEGTYATEGIFLKHNLTITGEFGVVLKGMGIEYVLRLKGKEAEPILVHLENLTFTDATLPHKGGCLLVDAFAEVHVNNVTFQDCQTVSEDEDSTGSSNDRLTAAIDIDDGSAFLKFCKFIRNSCDLSLQSGSGAVDVEDTTFEDSGIGADYPRGGNLLMRHGTTAALRRCRATVIRTGAGASHLWSFGVVSLTVTDSTFVGGASHSLAEASFFQARSEAGFFLFRNNTIREQSGDASVVSIVPRKAGASEATVEFDGMSIQGVNLTGDSAIISAKINTDIGFSALFRNVQFFHPCTAAYLVEANGNMIIESSRIKGSAFDSSELVAAPLWGFWVKAGKLTFRHSHVENWFSSGDIFRLAVSSSLSLENATISNITTLGGALLLSGSRATLNIVNSTLTDLHAGHDAPGVASLVRSQVSISGTLAQRCTSLTGDGGMMMLELCSLSLSNSQFLDNEASRNGGVFYINGRPPLESGGALNITNVVFRGNRAGIRGGAIFLSSGSSSQCDIGEATDVLFENCSAGNAGGAIFIQAADPESCSFRQRCDDCVFGNNSALYGEDEGTTPAQLQIAETPAHISERYHTLDAAGSITVFPSSTEKFAVSIRLRDNFGQEVVETFGTLLCISHEGDGVDLVLHGDGCIVSQRGYGTIDDLWISLAESRSSSTTSARVTAHQHPHIPPLHIHISVETQCPPGYQVTSISRDEEGITSRERECKKCPSGTYSFTGTHECERCPAGAICPGGEVVETLSGFHQERMNVSAALIASAADHREIAVMHPCHSAACCPDRKCPFESQCVAGHTGFLCGECKSGLYRRLIDGCGGCATLSGVPGIPTTLLAHFGSFLAAVCLLAWGPSVVSEHDLTRAHLAVTQRTPAQSKTNLTFVSPKPVLFFMYIAFLLLKSSSFSFTGDPASSTRRSLGNLAPYICFGTTSFVAHRICLLGTALLPFGYIGALWLLVRLVVPGHWRIAQWGKTSYAMSACARYWLISFIWVLLMCADLVHCTSVNGVSVLVQSPSVACYTKKHIPVLIGAWALAWLSGVILPIFATAWVYKRVRYRKAKPERDQSYTSSAVSSFSATNHTADACDGVIFCSHSEPPAHLGAPPSLSPTSTARQFKCDYEKCVADLGPLFTSYRPGQEHCMLVDFLRRSSVVVLWSSLYYIPVTRARALSLMLVVLLVFYGKSPRYQRDLESTLEILYLGLGGTLCGDYLVRLAAFEDQRFTWSLSHTVPLLCILAAALYPAAWLFGRSRLSVRLRRSLRAPSCLAREARNNFGSMSTPCPVDVEVEKSRNNMSSVDWACPDESKYSKGAQLLNLPLVSLSPPPREAVLLRQDKEKPEVMASQSCPPFLSQSDRLTWMNQLEQIDWRSDESFGASTPLANIMHPAPEFRRKERRLSGPALPSHFSLHPYHDFNDATSHEEGEIIHEASSERCSLTISDISSLSTFRISVDGANSPLPSLMQRESVSVRMRRRRSWQN